MNPYKCDECGVFISIDDLTSGRAVHSMVTPDSELSSEEYETLCAKHAKYTCAVHGVTFKLGEGCRMCINEQRN